MDHDRHGQALSGRCRGADCALHALLAVALVVLLVPLTASLPEPGLNAAWITGMDWFLERGLVFGRDVVFTHGPLADVRTGLYNAAFAWRTVLLGGVLAGAAWAGCLALRWTRRRGWALLLCLALALSVENDIRYMLVPLVFSLLALRVAFEGGGRAELLASAALLLAMALLVMVKGTALVWSGFAVGVAVVVFAWRRRWGWAVLSLAIPLAAVPVLWILAGQPLDAFPDYLSTLWQISYGYNLAMHSLGDVKQTILLLVCAGATVFWCVRRAEGEPLLRWALALCLAAYWFFAIKASVVRHDAHALIGGNFALLAPLALGVAFSGPRLGRVACFGLGVCLLVSFNFRYNPVSTALNAYAAAARGAWERVANPGVLEARKREALQSIARSTPLPRAQGTVDVYPGEIVPVLGAGMDWSPRPVFQSYSAYTPALEEMNRRHLLGPKAPETIFFHVDAIDRRYPALEDGPSWPVLLALYRPDGFAGDYAILRRRPQAAGEGRLRPLGEATARLNEAIAVPESAAPVYMTIDMRPTLAGKLANLFYKYDRIKFEVELEGGERREYRVIPLMAGAGFVVSPLVDSGRAFASLYPGGGGAPAPRVRSVRLVADRRFAWQWKPEFTVHFSAVDVPPAP